MIITKELENIFSNKLETKDKSFYTDKEVIIYGAGAMGMMALDFLKKMEINPKYFIDKNKKGFINSIKILKPEDLSNEEKKNSLIIICIVTCSYNSIMLEISKYNFHNVIHFYNYSNMFFNNLLSNGWDKFELKKEDIKQIKKVLDNLTHDETSVFHYLQFLWWRLRKVEKIYDNYPVLSNKKYFEAPCFPKINEDEKFLDIGAHHGTTINHFIKNSDNKFEKIWAFEPDENNFNTLKTFTTNTSVFLSRKAISNFKGRSNFIDNLGFASKLDKEGTKEVLVDKIDNLNLNPTIVKIHIEGAELQALKGAEKTIEKNRPIIMVLADHNEDGLFQIANFLLNLQNYKLYFYLHDYCGNSAVYYAIPKERKL